jgi:hypothetical protein
MREQIHFRGFEQAKVLSHGADRGVAVRAEQPANRSGSVAMVNVEPGVFAGPAWRILADRAKAVLPGHQGIVASAVQAVQSLVDGVRSVLSVVRVGVPVARLLSNARLAGVTPRVTFVKVTLWMNKLAVAAHSFPGLKDGTFLTRKGVAVERLPGHFFSAVAAGNLLPTPIFSGFILWLRKHVVESTLLQIQSKDLLRRYHSGPSAHRA